MRYGVLSSLAVIVMQIRGLIFDDANYYHVTNDSLRPVLVTGYSFSEFSPVNFTGLSFMVALLKVFFDANICCHVGGDFPTYLAGVQTFFEGVTMFIALKDNPLLKLIFQIGENTPGVFFILDPFILQSCRTWVQGMSVSTTSS
jgi:hypothetical protein